MDANEILGIVDEIENVKDNISTLLNNALEEMQSDGKKIFNKFAYQVADNATGRVYEDEVLEYIMDEIGYEFNKAVENQLEQRINTISNLVQEYEDYFTKIISQDVITANDIKNVDNYLNSISSEIDKVARRPFDFESILDEFKYSFRRNYGLNEGIMDFMYSGFRNLEEDLGSELVTHLRQPVHQFKNELYETHNNLRKNVINVVKKQTQDKVKDINVEFYLSEFQKIYDYEDHVYDELDSKNDEIDDPRLDEALANFMVWHMQFDEQLNKIKHEPNVEQQKLMIYTMSQAMNQIRDRYRRYYIRYNTLYEQVKAEKEREAELQRQEEEKQQRLAAKEAERKRIEEERRKEAEAQAQVPAEPSILDAVVDEIVKDQVRDTSVTQEEIEEIVENVEAVTAAATGAAAEEVVEEIVEEVLDSQEVVEEETIEEIVEEVVEDNVENNPDTVVEEVVEQLEDETPTVVVEDEVIEELGDTGLVVTEDQLEELVEEQVVEQVAAVEELEETGLVVVEQPQVVEEEVLDNPQVVEETGLVVAQPQVEQVVEETGLVVHQPNEVVTNNIDFTGLTPQRVVSSRKPIALIGEQVEQVQEEVLEEEIPTLDENEVVVDNTPVHSAKAESMRKIIDSKKAKYDKRATLAVLAAAGLGGATLIAGLPVALPLIAAGVAVVSVGGHLQVNLKEFAGRKANEFALSSMALMAGCELEYVDGKLRFCGKNGEALTQQQAQKLQRKLDRKYKNKYRGVSNPQFIEEFQYKGFDKVTIDNLNAAYDEFGGIKLEEIEDLMNTVNEVEVDLGVHQEEQVVTQEQEEVVEEVLTAAEVEVDVMERQEVPANTSVITRIINGDDVQVVQGEVVEEPQEEYQEEYQEEAHYEHQVDQDLISASQLLQNNVDSAIGSMNQSNIDSISQSCVDMFNGISDIFYNNRIENNEQLTAIPMHKFNDDVRKINDDLMTSVKNHFDNINTQAMIATDRLMQVPNENKAELISNLQNAYLKHASISGMMKDLTSNFDLLLDSICNQYGITKDSKAYSELVELMKQHETKIESNMYNQLIEFTNVNAMAISTVFNTFGYKEDLSESRSRGM